MFIRIFFTVIMALPTFSVSVAAAAQEIEESWTIVPTERHVLQSEILGKTVRIQVTVPRGYDPEHETYPVVYFTDDFSLGGTMRETVLYLSIEKIPKVITVGIDRDGNTRDEWYKERAFILTPRKFDSMEDEGVLESETGGAPLLGVNGIPIICHGGSPPKAIEGAIYVADRAAKASMVSHFVRELTQPTQSGSAV